MIEFENRITLKGKECRHMVKNAFLKHLKKTTNPTGNRWSLKKKISILFNITHLYYVNRVATSLKSMHTLLT